MSYLDYLKVIDKGAHSAIKHVEIYPDVKVEVYDNVQRYEMPLNKENLLTDIYDKMYLSHPLTYDQRQLMENYEKLRSGQLYSFTPSGSIVEPPKIAYKPKLTKKKIGLKKKK